MRGRFDAFFTLAAVGAPRAIHGARVIASVISARSRALEGTPAKATFAVAAALLPRRLERPPSVQGKRGVVLFAGRGPAQGQGARLVAARGVAAVTGGTTQRHMDVLPGLQAPESLSMAAHPRRFGAWLLAPVVAVAIAACGGASRALPIQRHPSPVAHAGSGPPAHIAVIVMENEEYGNVVGSRSAPFIDALARRYALATGMYAITHPSLPNYLALTGGSTFGIDSDCTDCSIGATSIVDQLEAAHLSWRGYMEDLPAQGSGSRGGRAGSCFTGASAGQYAKKHDPFAYYTRVVDNPTRCSNIVPLSRLSVDERSGSLPRFIWITPNLCHDMHDCSVATGDRFLAGLVPALLRSLGRGGLLFLTWDEGSSDDGCCRLASGGHIVTIVAGPGARPHARLARPTDHYSVLQTIEDLLGLKRLRGAACACTPSLEPLLARS